MSVNKHVVHIKKKYIYIYIYIHVSPPSLAFWPHRRVSGVGGTRAAEPPSAGRPSSWLQAGFPMRASKWLRHSLSDLPSGFVLGIVVLVMAR